MMKNLIIVRHAKSDWSEDWEDTNRPLMYKGVLRAEKHADLLYNSIDYLPEYWATSYANRALHTATIFANRFNVINKLRIQESLYTFSSQELHSFIQEIPDSIDSAILFGHNDACLDLINEISDTNLEAFKTASCGVISFDSMRWSQIINGKLVTLISKLKIL